VKLKLIVLCLFLGLSILFNVGCDTDAGSTGTEDNDSEESKLDNVNETNVEEIDNNYDQQDLDELIDDGALIFTFDDGFGTDYEVVYPILEEEGLQAVTYITPIFIEDVEGYMDWEQVKSLDKAGWDVECHSYTHANLKELTEVEIHEEMQKVDEAFKKQGLYKPEHHAFPHGGYDEDSKEVVFSYRTTARTVNNNLNELPIDQDDILLDAVDMGIHSIEVLKDLIDEAVENDKLIILFTHDVREKPYDYGIETDKFKSVLDHALKQEIEIITLSELMGENRN